MSIFLSTCSFISSSVSVITGFKQINAKVSTLLQPHKGLKVRDTDRRRLVAVHKRLECLIQPLNFCIMWSKDKDSCIQPTIEYALDLLRSVTDFLDKVKFETDELDPFTRILEADSSAKIDHYLRELEFACNSVSLAISITRGQSATEVSPSNGVRISPTALLRASRMISEMANRSGDLFAVKGNLYRREAGGGVWQLYDSDCVLRLTQFKFLDPVEAPYIIRVSAASESINFPIHTALSFRISTIRTAELPVSILVDSPVIVWKYGGDMSSDETVLNSSGSCSPPQISASNRTNSRRRLLHRNPSGEIDQDLTQLSIDSEDEETLIVRGAADVPSRLRPRVSSTHITGASSTAADYAFTFTSQNLSISPSDIVYVSRLCVLEAVKGSPASGSIAPPPGVDIAPASSPRPSVIGSQPLHLEASDETLIALLADATLPSQTSTCVATNVPDTLESTDNECDLSVRLVVEDV